MDKKLIIILTLIIIVVGAIILITSSTEDETSNNSTNNNINNNTNGTGLNATSNKVNENLKAGMKTFYEENKDKITVTEEQAKSIAKEAIENDFRYPDLVSGSQAKLKDGLRVYEDTEGNLRLGYNVLIEGTENRKDIGNMPIFQYYDIDAITGEIFKYKHSVNVNDL